MTQEVAAADDDGGEARFLGEPMEDEESRKQYPKRYVGKCPFVLLATLDESGGCGGMAGVVKPSLSHARLPSQ
ncbi:DNA (cytosine-5)-methyltransferase CMT3-like [Pyrus ussuriensis x Pyrus communis]|uniref:DNA (Cytosine-5)-methyltransferase CMT3-like n=1 Tax=Pyrus ussuriensis x Pyrus communis TaxID=2448454 RepID=A0A5N5GNU4_9ROSA|nr:DNA (cytosine-5)-methyltransferase CMT3-like [Pyrus ussuriensis x Pyrus communis]